MKYFYSLLIAMVTTLILPLKNHAQKTNTQDSIAFNYKPQQQEWIVPAGVTTLHVDAYGAQGGGENGGKGGRVQSDLKVKPGEKIIIYVGAQPMGNEAGYNGGGKGCGKGYGGGGATDIRLNGNGVESRVIIAGGGGGVGYIGYGGDGGGLSGGDGRYASNDTNSVYHIAKGGTQQTGGAGARAYYSPAGSMATGADGTDNRGNCSNNAMGGGGGGYYGGGASGAGGAGGGSSYTSTNNNENVRHTQGVQQGNGRLIIRWEAPKG